MWQLLIPLVLGASTPSLVEGRQAFQSMKYEAAIKHLSAARREPTLSVDERREAFDLLARCHAARGELDLTNAIYAELLAGDPHAPAPENAAPKIRDAFRQAKERLFSRDFVRLEQVAQGSDWIELTIVDPWEQVSTVTLWTSPPGAKRSFTAQTLTMNNRRARVSLGLETVHYYAEALNEQGQVVARLGAPDAPMLIGPPVKMPFATHAPGPARQPTRVGVDARQSTAPERSSSPLPWVLAGTGAAATVGSVIFGALSTRDSRMAGEAIFASDRRALDDAAWQKALAANLLLGLGLAAGGTAGYLFWAHE